MEKRPRYIPEEEAKTPDNVSDTSPMLIERADCTIPVDETDAMVQGFMDETKMAEEGSEMSMLDSVPTTQGDAAEESDPFKAPPVPSDLFAGVDLPRLQTRKQLKGELSITVKIPEDLYRALLERDRKGRTTADTLFNRALAHRKLLNYLDNFRWALTEDNVLEICDDKTIDPSVDLPRVRRAITALQLEVDREMDRLYRCCHKKKYGENYQFVIDSPTS